MSEIDEDNVRLVEEFVTQKFSIKKAPPKKFDNETGELLVACLIKGEEQYQLFRNEKITTRTKQLFATIPKPRKLTNEMKNVVKTDIKEETIAAGRSIDYTQARSYDIRKLLTYELASTSFFNNRRISAKTRKIRVAEMYSNE